MSPIDCRFHLLINTFQNSTWSVHRLDDTNMNWRQFEAFEEQWWSILYGDITKRRWQLNIEIKIAAFPSFGQSNENKSSTANGSNNKGMIPWPIESLQVLQATHRSFPTTRANNVPYKLQHWQTPFCTSNFFKILHRWVSAKCRSCVEHSKYTHVHFAENFLEIDEKQAKQWSKFHALLSNNPKDVNVVRIGGFSKEINLLSVG